MSRADPDPPTVDRLRADIDRGQTAEKVAGEDPAAAPLGTDAEAGGVPPTRAEREIEYRSRPASTETGGGTKVRRWMWAAGLLVLVLIVTGILAAGR